MTKIKQSATLSYQLSLLSLGIVTGFLINIFNLYALNPIPFTEEYLFNIEEKWMRLLLVKLGITYQYFISSLVVIPIFGLTLGFQNYKSPFFNTRLFAIGVILFIAFKNIHVFSGRHFDTWLIIYIFQVVIVFILSYAFIKIGEKIKSHLTRKSTWTK